MDQRSTDWFSALLGHDVNVTYANEGQANGQEVDDENADFYGESEAQAGATNNADRVEPKLPVQSIPAQQNTPTTAVNAEGKTEQQLRAEYLRAKLLANKKTPFRQHSASRSNTPAKAIQAVETPTKAPAPQSATPVQTPAQQPPPQNALQSNMNTDMNGDGEPAGDMFDMESLLSQGKALADAKSAAMAADAATAVASPAHTDRTASLTNGHGNTNANAKKNSNQHKNTIKKEAAMNVMNMNKSTPADREQEQPTPIRTRPAEPAPQHPQTNLSDAYYVDLPAWLEMTGYHDVEFRNSKLSAYKERKSLEEEAARIAERLEKLRQLEQESAQSLRFSTPKPATAMAPPPLPSSISVERPTGQVNGTKRAHSPDPLSANKRREENGFHIRGANESPSNTRPPTANGRRPQSPSPPAINRRISYPDARRRSDDENRSRDPSLERRQSYYRRESDDRRGPQPDYGRERERERERERDYDSYQPRGDGPRLGFSTTNMARPGGRNGPPPAPASQYRGSAGLDLKRGGIRYFMIKSWNYENVLAAQRDNLWATQQHNTELLTTAFQNSRYVILLFSVNKSMAFQGYALMTTAPDPQLPKPASAGKLNWKTSPAFKLRWLGTTPVHFRRVGHLKNRMNLDERGEERAVLVGKDGQEVSEEAGMGVVWVLDEAEASEGQKVMGGRRVSG